MAALDQSQVVDDVLTLLSLSAPADQSLIQRVSIIVDGITRALSIRIGGVTVPAELGYIVRDVSLSRYNRIGSEGVSSHSVEGEEMTWTHDDFAAYAGDINLWIAKQRGPGGGIVRFL